MKETTARRGFGIICVLLTIYVVHVYISHSDPWVARLGNVGCFLSGIGLLFLGLQYFAQATALKEARVNENHVRTWNATSMVDDAFLNYSKFKNNRDRIASKLKTRYGIANSAQLREDITELQLENNLLIKYIGNKIATLEILYKQLYFNDSVLEGCQKVFGDLRADFIKHKLATESVDYLIKHVPPSA